jgi:hypothetical protein
MNDRPRFPDVTVQLSGKDGNAFAVLGRIRTALQDAGHYDAAAEFMTEAMAGDYDHLIRTAMAYVDVQ